MKKTVVSFIVCCLLNPSGIYAVTNNTIAVNGIIKDKTTNENIPFARVTAVKPDGSISSTDTSDENGQFLLPAVSTDSKINVVSVGYISHIVSPETNMNIQLVKDTYAENKAREQSIENRALTALTVAATGIGGMQLAQGLAEQKADQDAERDMKAYMATFRCEYNNGKSVKGGTKEIELPGGKNPEIIKLRNEYFALAADLKERKEALGMKPGIETEVILDKAQMGLYDDENVGITDGVYASLYRAAMGNEKDQAKLQEMKDTSKKRVVGGAIAVAAGTVVGIAGNQIINGKKTKKETKEIAESVSKLSMSSTQLNKLNRTGTVLSTSDTNDLLKAIQERFK